MVEKIKKGMKKYNNNAYTFYGFFAMKKPESLKK